MKHEMVYDEWKLTCQEAFFASFNWKEYFLTFSKCFVCHLHRKRKKSKNILICFIMIRKSSCFFEQTDSKSFFLIINSRGQIHQHIQAAFSCKQDEELFWQMAFGEWRINLANLMLYWVNFTGKEGNMRLCLICLAHKGWWNCPLKANFENGSRVPLSFVVCSKYITLSPF